MKKIILQNFIYLYWIEVPITLEDNVLIHMKVMKDSSYYYLIKTPFLNVSAVVWTQDRHSEVFAVT